MATRIAHALAGFTVTCSGAEQASDLCKPTRTKEARLMKFLLQCVVTFALVGWIIWHLGGLKQIGESEDVRL